MQAEPVEISESDCYPSKFTQWVGENIDHNLAMLDGKSTFHGMGIISIASFRKNIIEKSVCIARKSRIKASEPLS